MNGLVADQGFVNSEVQTIIEHSNGEIWIGTLGGLARIDGGLYTDYVAEDGLEVLSIHTLLEDHEISTKPKPFELPVSLSITRVQDCTVP